MPGKRSKSPGPGSGAVGGPERDIARRSKNCGGPERSGLLGELELDRVGEDVVAKLVVDPRLTQKRQFLQARICGIYHNEEVA